MSADHQTVAGYARHWRETHLPHLVKNNGKPLGEKTRGDYARMLRHEVERHGPFQNIAVSSASTRDVRQFLSQWMPSPAYYNYVKAVLSKMFAHAVDEGLLDANPVTGVVRRATARREVVLTRDCYLRITAGLEDWEARACDLIYLLSHRPSDVLRLRDETPWVRYDRRGDADYVVVSFTAAKNGQAVEISDRTDTPGGIEDTLHWFRAWKRQQGTAAPSVMCFPATARAQDAGRPISRDYLSRRFAEAVVVAGFEPGQYTLRDLRKTGLTDEAVIAGEATKKGGHKTEAMRQYYVVGSVPQRVHNNLSVMR